MWILEESYKRCKKNQNFDNFEGALYLKSGSMPLTSMLKHLGLFIGPTELKH